MDDEPLEHTQTKQQWEELQMEIGMDGSLTVLSAEEKAEILRLTLLATEQAITSLINNHPVEYEALLLAARRDYGIDKQTTTPMTSLVTDLDIVPQP